MLNTIRTISYIFFLLMLGNLTTVAARSSLPLMESDSDNLQHRKAVEFLNTNEELLHNHESHFTGEFLTIPEDLKVELSRAFPEYEFLIAKMIVTQDFPSRRQDLILVTDATSEEVLSYVWGAYWTLPPSASSKQILKGKKAKSAEDAICKMESLARLIVYAINKDLRNNDAAGKVTIQKGTARAELLRGGGAFRILTVELSKSFRFGRMTIALPR